MVNNNNFLVFNTKNLCKGAVSFMKRPSFLIKVNNFID